MSTIDWDGNSRQNIYDFIFEMAFRDATLRNAFVNPYKRKNKSEGKTDKKSEKQAEEDFEKLKNEIRNHIKISVAKYLESILDNEYSGEVLEQSKYKCMLDVLNDVKDFNTQIKKIDSEHKGFTFGNVQKLANMSAKYLYIACYANPEIRTRFDYCDCPMDSIMIKGIIKEAGNIEFEKLKDNTSWSGLSFEIGNCENVEEFQKLIPKEYVEFQEWIRNHREESENMLDYDFRKWTEWSEDY